MKEGGGEEGLEQARGVVGSEQNGLWRRKKKDDCGEMSEGLW